MNIESNSQSRLQTFIQTILKECYGEECSTKEESQSLREVFW